MKKDLYNSHGTNLAPIGIIKPYNSITAPKGWIICDGSWIDKVTYINLYNIIGDAFGTYNATLFKLPDLRDRFAYGVTNSANIGSCGGSNTYAHVHSIYGHSHRAYNVNLTAANQPFIGAPNVIPTKTSSQGGEHYHAIKVCCGRNGYHPYGVPGQYMQHVSTGGYTVSSSEDMIRSDGTHSHCLVNTHCYHHTHSAATITGQIGNYTYGVRGDDYFSSGGSSDTENRPLNFVNVYIIKF